MMTLRLSRRRILLCAFAVAWLTFGAMLFALDEGVNAAALSGSVPVRLRIARLGVDAPVIPVGKTTEGEMDTPASISIAGWYYDSALPGRDGAAVITGHLNSLFGTPGIFARLEELQAGDLIEVEDADGNVSHFIVKRSRAYTLADAPLETIFGSADGPLLHLITCAGDWDGSEYSERLVVYAQGIE